MSAAEIYYTQGCGRCSKMATPACKIHRWTQGLADLRQIVQGSGLVENLKWGHPCYTQDGKNICMIAAYNDSMVLSFFKGALIDDPQNLLVRQGENTQSARVLRWEDCSLIPDMAPTILQMIAQAIQIEQSGAKVQAAAPMEIPAELEECFGQSPEFKTAFESLTPGRQRAYLLHFGSAKQSATKSARIEKCRPAILAGKGLND